MDSVAYSQVKADDGREEKGMELAEDYELSL